MYPATISNCPVPLKIEETKRCRKTVVEDAYLVAHVECEKITRNNVINPGPGDPR